MGHNVLTTEESGHADSAVSDEAILEFSTSEKRILLTFNRKHFIKLHNSGIKHSGIITCTFDVDFEALAGRIDAAVKNESNLNGKLIRINRVS